MKFSNSKKILLLCILFFTISPKLYSSILDTSSTDLSSNIKNDIDLLYDLENPY